MELLDGLQESDAKLVTRNSLQIPDAIVVFWLASER
jgi:hypothetical protein